MAQSTRQRRQLPPDEGISSVSDSRKYSKEDKPGSLNKKAATQSERSFVILTIVALGLLRYMSATTNIIHDCDEVFNYWEPLHFLLYKTGFQTWEYSSQFALRSYLYINFHQLVASPASWLLHFLEEEKVKVFYAVRLFLGILSVVADATLVIALSRRYGRRLASYALAMLCLTSGCFFASTSFLPSSFSMYAVSFSSGLFLMEKYASAVAFAAFGVILGWPFAVLVFLPIVFSSLSRSLKRSFLAGALVSSIFVALSAVADYHYYGRWTSSIFNLLVYNVVGGGESHLYGVEGHLFYLKNGFNNFNVCFVLAMLLIVIVPIVKRKYSPDLLIVVAPIYLWLAFMSLQPHKEERFLYPIYPLLCVASSAFIESLPDLFRDRYDSNDSSILVMVAKSVRPIILSLILCASHARTFSLINGYGSPIEVYKILEHHDDVGTDPILCVGSEWHRFPSSFFVPSYIKEVKWIDDGFRGLLPLPFNSSLGGTAAAPPYFNNKNTASDVQFLRNLEVCTFLVELQLNRPYPTRGHDLSTWETIAAIPFLDRDMSPPFHRSFFIPYMWQHKNVFGMYKLLRRVPK